MKTLLTTLWAVLLIAIFSTLFTLWVKALIELIEWIIWRLKLQKKRCKEKRQVKRNSKN